ncbi:GNAT family N-acetyltransferase [Tenacibaculum sp. IB213877]|uniref:GNAT family N-acetyltransferase n=1 Tax=Tenacibaculum sp. IB213877 TaxID=3097351 RepID=UPI002A5A9C14|nr:GNAT family N-acetyltransferase [Tenacibaculum sp. IB213877]MDY0780181.1 GNAT family N-acetyltransferase [Tenacibaculum sp. IB213877]
MKAIYRKVQEEDNKALASMIRSVFEEHNAPQQGTVYTDPTTDYLYDLFKNPKSVLWVAEVDGKALGCCGIYPTEGLNNDCVELVKFYISNTIRNKGIGKELMQKSLDSAKELGYKEVYLESLPHFAKAVSMYEKLGFKKLEKSLGNSEHPTCNIWMLKHL